MLGLGGGEWNWDEMGGGGYIYLCIIVSSCDAGLDLLTITSLSGQQGVGRSGGMKRGMRNAEHESVVWSANFVEEEEEAVVVVVDEEEVTGTSRWQIHSCFGPRQRSVGSPVE